MKLIFGKGDILVTQCGNGEIEHVLFEQGRGAGKVGAKNPDALDRQAGMMVSGEDIDNATVTFTFDNPASCAVVMEKLLVNMVAFRKNGNVVGPENIDLVESVNYLWDELHGKYDEVAE